MNDFKEKIKSIPNSPGVYLMKDYKGTIIYVGKAKDLKKRVSQYFTAKRKEHTKVRHMVEHIADIDYVIVDNEVESLVLEANFIKEYRPKYNILMRDDKHYPYIKITKEPYPRILKVREVLNDDSQYYGPYPSGTSVNLVLETIHDLFPIRNCRYYLPEQGPPRPCLNFDIGRCLGPCTLQVSREQYQNIIDKVIKFIQGKDKKSLDFLKEKMKEASENLQFEQAAQYRDKLEAIEWFTEKQVADQAHVVEQDVIGIARNDDITVAQVYFVRKGKIIGRENYQLEHSEDYSHEEVLSFFIRQLYSGAIPIPKEIIIDRELTDKEVLEEWLSTERGNKVQLIKPQRGEKVELLNLAKKNAIEKLYKGRNQWKIAEKNKINQLISLKELIKLEEVPHRIEAYDISHISGIDAVGSMIVFKEGRPSKQDYRKFRIKKDHAQDDYASLKEVLERRIKRGLKITGRNHKDLSFNEFPDLILIDGGKGQVSGIEELMMNYGVFIPIAGMVKDDAHQTRGIIFENEEYSLTDSQSAMHLIAQIQNEAHRFAIDYHRSLRSKRLTTSILDDIPGIGPKRRQALLKHFGDVNTIRNASKEEIARVPGISNKVASTICGFFKGQNG